MLTSTSKRWLTVAMFIIQCRSPLWSCSSSKWQGIVKLNIKELLVVIKIITASSVQTLENGDMALLDMGAEYHFYGSDITCSFPVSSYICVCNLPFTLLVEYSMKLIQFWIGYNIMPVYINVALFMVLNMIIFFFLFFPSLFFHPLWFYELLTFLWI